MYTLNRYVLVDCLQMPRSGYYKSEEISEAFIGTGWRTAVVKFDSRKQAKSTVVALRKYIQKHDKPILCSMIGGALVLERTDIGN